MSIITHYLNIYVNNDKFISIVDNVNTLFDSTFKISTRIRIPFYRQCYKMWLHNILKWILVTLVYSSVQASRCVLLLLPVIAVQHR